MNIELIIGILNIVLISTTPLVFAGIGELVTEKSGVLNLGLEGLMLVLSLIHISEPTRPY